MAETEQKKVTKKSPMASHAPLIVLVVLLVVAALTLGIGLRSESSSARYGCMSISQSGSTVQLSTSGIIHVDGSQYYITCSEGDTNPTSPITVGCLSVTPKVTTFTYPAAQNTERYYLSAQGHTITVPPAASNSTDVLQTSTSVQIQVAC